MNAEPATGLRLAVESYGIRHGIGLLSRVGAAFALWFRRSGSLELVRSDGALQDAGDVAGLLDVDFDEAIADLRRLGGPLEVPARLPDGTAWVARLLSLPEGAVGAIWLERRPAALAKMPSASVVEQVGVSTPVVDPEVPRRLMSIAAHVAGLSPSTPRLAVRARAMERALTREAWKLLGHRESGLPVDTTKAFLHAKVLAVKPALAHLVPSHVEITWEVGAERWGVEAPTAAVRFILEELIRNALDGFGTDGGGRLRIRCGDLALLEDTTWHYQVLRAGSYAFLEVTDDGAGIPADDIEALVAGQHAGGIRAIQGLARAWGGAFRMRSAVGRGTIVQVAFPAHLDGNSDATLASPTVGELGAALVVMVSGRTRDRVVEGLERVGLAVMVASDSESAKTMRQQHSDGIALLVVCHHLPDGEAIELARSLRESDIHLPVVIMSDDPVDEVEYEMDDLAPGRVVPLQYAAHMAVGAAKALLQTS